MNMLLITRIISSILIISITNFTNCSSTTPYAKKAVFILGTPRSGTSATAGVLHILGLNLGNNLSVPSPWNIKGDFEDLSVRTINKKITKELGISPYDNVLLFSDWNCEKAQKSKDEIKKYIHTSFSHCHIFGLKHHQICLLLPLYVQAAQELGYTPKLIVVTRDAQEIIKSLNATEKQKNNILSFERGMIFINNFLNAIEKHSAHVDNVTITFDELLENPEKTIEIIRSILPELTTYADRKGEIDNFLSKDLKHHNIKDNTIYS